MNAARLRARRHSRFERANAPRTPDESRRRRRSDDIRWDRRRWRRGARRLIASSRRCGGGARAFISWHARRLGYFRIRRDMSVGWRNTRANSQRLRRSAWTLWARSWAPTPLAPAARALRRASYTRSRASTPLAPAKRALPRLWACRRKHRQREHCARRRRRATAPTRTPTCSWGAETKRRCSHTMR